MKRSLKARTEVKRHYCPTVLMITLRTATLRERSTVWLSCPQNIIAEYTKGQRKKMRLPPYIVRQLGNPTGFLGRLILRRLNSSNHSMNAITFKSLEIVDTDRILEIGFGGGALLNNIMSSGPALVAGAKISGVALRDMLRRHKNAVNDGWLQLTKIENDSIPFPTGSFSKVCCVNVVYFWDDPHSMLGDIYRVLEAGGKSVICYQKTGPDDREFPPDLIEAYLSNAGFVDLVTCGGDDRRNGIYFCTTATKPITI